jgi:hypothetical protein
MELIMGATRSQDTPAITPAAHTTRNDNGQVEDHGRRLTTETKASFKTTEFFAMVAVIVGILISAAVIKGTGADSDIFTASKAWLYVAIVASAYMISRGLAKSGSNQPYDERS